MTGIAVLHKFYVVHRLSVVVVNGLIRSDLFLIIVQGIMTLSVILNYYGIYYHVARVEMVDDETKTRQQREKLAYRKVLADLCIQVYISKEFKMSKVSSSKGVIYWYQ